MMQTEPKAHRAVCPCACSAVVLSNVWDVLAWRCMSCRQPMLGIPIPINPKPLLGKYRTCIEALIAAGAA